MSHIVFQQGHLPLETYSPPIYLSSIVHINLIVIRFVIVPFTLVKHFVKCITVGNVVTFRFIIPHHTDILLSTKSTHDQHAKSNHKRAKDQPAADPLHMLPKFVVFIYLARIQL